MTKKLRIEEIFIAPEILGKIDDNGSPIVYDEREDKKLDPRNIDDKIKIYERQVKDWFLLPAQKILNDNNITNSFIVLMICFSYLEGVEQYKSGQVSNGKSKSSFANAIKRIYPDKYQTKELEDLYIEARCGLFHNGMVKGRVLVNNSYSESILFELEDIKINPKKLLDDIKEDFDSYILELNVNVVSRNSFDQMFTNIKLEIVS